MGPQKRIQRVAVCGGAGSFLLPQAIQAGVDAFLTADIPYHRFFEAEGHLYLTDVGHFESERFIAKVFADRIRAAFPELPVYASRIRTSPIHYAI
jgi:putative NIF3 family GTP cyclohydrolase 1 type 2